MTYPRSLDEYGDDELKAELERRVKLKKDGRCTYCERSTTSSACRFPERHSKKGRSKPPVLVIGDTSYELTQAFCEGALSYHYDVPYNTGNPLRRRGRPPRGVVQWPRDRERARRGAHGSQGQEGARGGQEAEALSGGSDD